MSDKPHSTMPHYVSEEEYDPNADRQILDRVDLDASTWVLVWRRLRRHRLGVFCGLFLALVYLMLPFMEIIAPYDPNQINEDGITAFSASANSGEFGSIFGVRISPERN